MTAPSPDEKEDKALDPAVERVRRKLVRFIVINLGLLFAAVIIVIGAVVYRSAKTETAPTAASDVRVPSGEVLEDRIQLPVGGRIVSHTLSGNRVSVDVQLPDGQRMIVIYDLSERAVIARLVIGSE